MEYKIVKETHPTLKNYGKYKAVAMHYKTVTPEEIADEIERNCRVRIPGLGLAKLEIDSEKVASPQAFRSTQHIHGVKLHLLPESKQGMQELYKDIKYTRAKTK